MSGGALYILAPSSTSRFVLAIRGIIAAGLASLWDLYPSLGNNVFLARAMVAVYAAYIVEHTVGMTLRTSYVGSLGAILSGITSALTIELCEQNIWQISISVIVTSLLAYLLPLNPIIQNIWIAFHAATVTIPLFHSSAGTRIAWDTTISSLLGVVCALVASIIPFPHLSITEVKARLCIVAQMYEGVQRMIMNAFTRELFLRGRPILAKPAVVDDILSQAKGSSRQSDMAVRCENQATMGLESISPSLSWQQRSPLLHASNEHLEAIMKTNMDRIERELPFIKWEGLGAVAFSRRLWRSFSARRRLTKPQALDDQYQLLEDGATVSYSHQTATDVPVANSNMEANSMGSNLPHLLATESLLNRENEQFERLAIESYDQGHRNKRGKRNLIEKLYFWNERMQKLRQMSLLMSESQTQTDFVSNFKEGVAASMCDVISTAIDTSTSLLHMALFVSLSDSGCARNVLHKFSESFPQSSKEARNHIELSSEISFDDKPSTWYHSEDGKVVPVVSKPGTVHERKKLYQLRHRLLECLRELTKRYGQVRMRCLYSLGQRPQIPQNVALRHPSFNPPPSTGAGTSTAGSNTLNRVKGGTSVQGTHKRVKAAIETAQSDKESQAETESDTSFDRQSDQDDQENWNEAVLLSAAMGPVSCLLFCIIRTAWITIESADELCGLKHASNESEEGAGEDRTAPAHEAVNVNMSSVERQQSINQREARAKQLVNHRSSRNTTVTASPALSFTLNFQTSYPSEDGSPLESYGTNLLTNEQWRAEKPAWYQRDEMLERRSLIGKVIYQTSDLIRWIKAKVFVRRAVHVTAAVLAASSLPIVPYLRERFPYSYWAPVSAAFIAGTSAGSNFRAGSIRLLGTVLGCIVGYMTIVIANANRWAVGAVFTVFNGICMYASSDSYNVYQLVAKNAGFTAPMVMLGTGYPDDPSNTEITEGAALGRVLHTVVGILVLLCISQVLLPIRASQQVHDRSLKALKLMDAVVTNSLQAYVMFVHGASEQNLSHGAMMPTVEAENDIAARRQQSFQSTTKSVAGKMGTSAGPSTTQNLSNVRQMLDRSNDVYKTHPSGVVDFTQASKISYDPTKLVSNIEKELNTLVETIPEAEIEPELWYTPFSEHANLYTNFVNILHRCLRAITAINQSRLSLIRQHAHHLNRMSKQRESKATADSTLETSSVSEGEVLSGIHLLLPLLPRIHRLQLAISETTHNIIALLHLFENLHENQRTRFKHRQDEANRRKASFHENNAREIREMGKVYDFQQGLEPTECPQSRRPSLIQHINDIEPTVGERHKEEIQNAKMVLLSLEKSSDSVSDALQSFQKLFAHFTQARVEETREARLDHEVTEEQEELERRNSASKPRLSSPSTDRKKVQGNKPVTSTPNLAPAPFPTQSAATDSSGLKSPDEAYAFEADYSSQPFERRKEARKHQGYDLGAGRGPSAFSNALVLNINTVAFGLQQLSGALSDLSSCAAKLYYSKLLSSTKLSQKPWDIYSELVKRLPWQMTVASHASTDEDK